MNLSSDKTTQITYLEQIIHYIFVLFKKIYNILKIYYIDIIGDIIFPAFKTKVNIN